MGGLHECHDISKGQPWDWAAGEHPSTALTQLWEGWGALQRENPGTPLQPLWDDPKAAPSLAATLSIGFWRNISNK